MKHWYKQSHKSTHTTELCLLLWFAATFIVKQKRKSTSTKSACTHDSTAISVTDKWLANKVLSSHTLTVLHTSLPRPQGTTRTGKALPGVLLQQHRHRVVRRPLFHPAQRVPDSELATSRGLTTEPADTGPNSAPQRGPSGTAGAARVR